MHYRKSIPVVALLALVMAGSPSHCVADDDEVVKRVDGDLLKELLEEEGYKGITVDKPNEKIHIVRVKMDGKRVVFVCDLEDGLLQGRFGVSGTNANLRKLNDWNESKRFFKGYLDKDGDPNFTYDLVIKHGVTKKTAKEFALIMDSGVKAFLKEVCQ